jgi:hypothetical protein
MSALVLRAALSATGAPPERSGASGAPASDGVRESEGRSPSDLNLMDLSSLLQGATHVFPVAAQDCVRTRRDHEFRVYVDKIVDLSQQQVLTRERAQTGEPSVPPGIMLEQELGTENRCLSTAPALL